MTGEGNKQAKSGQAPEQQVIDIKTMPEIFVRYREGLESAPAAPGEMLAMTANAQATEAAAQILKAGGSAVDAAIAAQTVLGLVEPQSSGIGGGAFILYYHAATGEITAWDGRETAPAAAKNSSYLTRNSQGGEVQPSLRSSGRSIGVPGVMRTLQKLHDLHGVLPWAETCQPAISLAEGGYVISERMAESLKRFQEDVCVDADAAALYYPEGEPPASWSTGTNPAYAATMSAIAERGADALYEGPIAEAIVAKANSGRGGVTPGELTLSDLAGYQPVVRTPIRGTFQGTTLVTFPPPSSGGIAVLETLGLLEKAGIAALKNQPPHEGVPGADVIHRVAEAERLAYADRDAYVGDPDYVPAPKDGWSVFFSESFLDSRVRQLGENSMGVAAPAKIDLAPAPGQPAAEQGTSHFQIVDGDGNAIAVTTSVEAAFGSFHMVGGFFLNNELSDFSLPDEGEAVNEIAPGKRPRSAMAPTMLFKDGELWGLAGSPGGALIIQYLVKSLLGLLLWKQHPQEAANLMNFGAMNTPLTWVGGDHPNFPAHRPDLLAGLANRGHLKVATWSFASGISLAVKAQAAQGPAAPGPSRDDGVQEGVVKQANLDADAPNCTTPAASAADAQATAGLNGWLVGVDPRREGTAWVGGSR